MKTIKEITAQLKEATIIEEWMQEIEKDERTSVQKAWNQFLKRLEKANQLIEAHEEKLQFDASFLSNGAKYLAGTDEAGRGPLAGPVVTAAVILPNFCEELLGINDSKQLSKAKREEYAERIKQHALAYEIHFQPEQAIDEYNIYEATRMSMKTCIDQLSIKPDYVIADAMTLDINISQTSVIKGDAKSLTIAAASILAKTARDHYMDELHEQYPQYGFNQHAGYGTKQHLEAIEQYGPTEHHRKTFEPIKTILSKG